MIHLVTGNILDADAEALVNTVNCVGFMGRGIAAQFKRRFPQNFKAYEAVCKRGDLKPGVMFSYATGNLTNPRYVINFPTKRHWKGNSRIEDIESGLHALLDEVQSRKIRSIAIPPLGCGLGGLDWREVRPLIEQAFAALSEVKVLLFEPSSVAPAVAPPSSSAAVPKMTPGRAVLIGLMDRYLGGLLDPFVSLLEVHKLMYFAQEAGQPLRLKYVKGTYGPYAENLRHVLGHIEGHLIAGYADGGDAPDKQLSLVPGAIDDAQSLLKEHPDALARFERVSSLVDGFETPFGMELLATVHWTATHDNVRGDALVSAVHNWSERKRNMTPRQIGIAETQLSLQGWLSAPAN